MALQTSMSCREQHGRCPGGQTDAERNCGGAGRCDRRGRLCPRQRQRPVQSPQSVRGRSPCRKRAWPRCCSICWRKKRPRIGTRSLTSSFWRERLRHAAAWLKQQPETAALRLAYFGASTGAAAALVAAAREPGSARAVVSGGGRPDLAHQYLHAVAAPTLLIVGGNDDVVIDLNEAAPRRAALPQGHGRHSGCDAPIPGAGRPRGSLPAGAGLVRPLPQPLAGETPKENTQ